MFLKMSCKDVTHRNDISFNSVVPLMLLFHIQLPNSSHSIEIIEISNVTTHILITNHSKALWILLSEIHVHIKSLKCNALWSMFGYVLVKWFQQIFGLCFSFPKYWMKSVHNALAPVDQNRIWNYVLWIRFIHIDRIFSDCWSYTSKISLATLSIRFNWIQFE